MEKAVKPAIKFDYPRLDFHIRQISDRLDVIAQREDDWDELESKKPNAQALNRARVITEALLDSVISAGYSWLMPFICSDEDGYITLSWHKGKHELHLDITEDEAEYCRVWGIKIDTEMDQGVLSSDNFLRLWEWLIDG